MSGQRERQRMSGGEARRREKKKKCSQQQLDVYLTALIYNIELHQLYLTVRYTAENASPRLNSPLSMCRTRLIALLTIRAKESSTEENRCWQKNAHDYHLDESKKARRTNKECWKKKEYEMKTRRRAHPLLFSSLSRPLLAFFCLWWLLLMLSASEHPNNKRAEEIFDYETNEERTIPPVTRNERADRTDGIIIFQVISVISITLANELIWRDDHPEIEKIRIKWSSAGRPSDVTLEEVARRLINKNERNSSKMLCQWPFFADALKCLLPR